MPRDPRKVLGLNLSQPGRSHIPEQFDVHLPVQGDPNGLLVDLIGGQPGQELLNDRPAERRDEEVVLQHVDPEDVLALEPEHGVVPGDDQLHFRVLARDGREDRQHCVAGGRGERLEVLVHGVEAPGTCRPPAVQDKGIGMGLAEAVVLPKIGDLLGVLAVGDLLHLVKPVGHWLSVLLLDQGEVRGPVGLVDRHTREGTPA